MVVSDYHFVGGDTIQNCFALDFYNFLKCFYRRRLSEFDPLIYVTNDLCYGQSYEHGC